MDLKDRRILFELNNNSRIPLKQLAKKVRLSQSSTSHRINKLENEGVILGYYPIIDNSKLGYQGFRAYLRFFGTTPAEEEQILNWLNEQSEVAVLGLISGSYDVFIMSWVKNVSVFNEFIKRFKEKFREKITNLETFNYLKALFFPRNYLVPDSNKKDYLIIGGETRVPYDKTDLKILRALIADARKSTVKISKETKIPIRTVAYRLKKMEKSKIIVGYSLNIDISRLGYEYYKLNITFNKNVNYNMFISFAQELKNTAYVDETLGKFDFELNVEIKNRGELDKIVNQLKIMSGGIRLLEIFSLKKFIKLTSLSQEEPNSTLP